MQGRGVALDRVFRDTDEVPGSLTLTIAQSIDNCSPSLPVACRGIDRIQIALLPMRQRSPHADASTNNNADKKRPLSDNNVTTTF